jgi:cytochrome c oxidase subunit 1
MTDQAAARPDDQVNGEGPRPTRWRGVVGFNLLSAIVLALLGYAIGEWIGQRIGTHIDFVAATDQNDVALLLGYVLAVVGWLAGLGFLNYPLGRMIGRSVDLPVRDPHGVGRYFRLTTDHKVVGLQYFVGIGFFFFLGGLNAMLIRAELLSPDSSLFPPGQYLTIVSLHGTMMIMMMSSVILGPFGNYFVPLMIGAKGMAFPRIEALTFWLLPMAGVILFSAVWVGGISTGWTGYPTLADQAQRGMDSYVVAFALIAISLVLVGINMIATIVNMRAPGLTWQRLPIFVWSVLATSSLMVLGAPVLVGGLLMIALDRTASTSFFLPSGGGTPFLYENIFWFFGHPEVYILALPGFGVVLEILPVFSRKPLWAYRLAVAGMLGVCLLSFMVWQHHLFVSGINGDLRPFYMFTTELISVPTGFIFLVAMGTIWRARIRYTVPMLFSLAFFFNFLIGGLSGVFLSDVPSDVSLHGSYFVMAHFHYTIMGGLVFAFFAATYYWLPKMTGRQFNERLAKVHFWGMFVAFNSTFLPLFAVGMMGMPRRVVTYAPHLQWLNVWVSVSAFCLGAFMLVFLANLIWSQVIHPVAAGANPWAALSLEWQLPTPVPSGNFVQVPTILADPYQYGVPNALPVVDLTPAPLPVVS